MNRAPSSRHAGRIKNEQKQTCLLKYFEENDAAFVLRGLLAAALRFCARDPYHMHSPLPGCCVQGVLGCEDIWFLGDLSLQGPFCCFGNAQGFLLGSAGVQDTYPGAVFSVSTRHGLWGSM